MMRIAFTLALSLLVAPVVCSNTPTAQEVKAPSPSVCGAPQALDDGWQTDAPESQGFDGSRLCVVADRLEEADDVHGIVVARHGVAALNMRCSARIAFTCEAAGASDARIRISRCPDSVARRNL
jgi:hypothetical protein